MKKLLMLSLAAMMAVSCAAIEDATSKYKTPEAPDAGLKDGEKSHYLIKDETPAPAQTTTTTKKKPAKKKTK